MKCLQNINNSLVFFKCRACIISLLLIVSSYSLFAQNEQLITKAWAYSVLTIGGAPLQISEGEAEKISKPTLLIYIALQKATHALYKVYTKQGVMYTAQAKKVTTYPLQFLDGEMIIAKPIPHLYQLILNENVPIPAANTSQIIKSSLLKNDVIIGYSVAGKAGNFVIKHTNQKNIALP